MRLSVVCGLVRIVFTAMAAWGLYEGDCGDECAAAYSYIWSGLFHHPAYFERACHCPAIVDANRQWPVNPYFSFLFLLFIGSRKISLEIAFALILISHTRELKSTTINQDSLSLQNSHLMYSYVGIVHISNLLTMAMNRQPTTMITVTTIVSMLLF